MTTENLTHAQVAERFGISSRTLSRILSVTPGLTFLKVGRLVLFRPADIARLERALQHETGGYARSNRTVTVYKASKPTNSALDAAHAARQKRLQDIKDRKAARKGST